MSLLYPKHVMIDLETLSSKSNAAIVAIGAVMFDAYGPHSNFYCQVDAKDCQRRGMDIDADTVMWWFKQSQAARDATFNPEYKYTSSTPKEVFRGDLTICLKLLSDWVIYTSPKNSDSSIMYPQVYNGIVRQIYAPLSELSAKEENEIRKSVRLWGNGATFDNVVLRNAYAVTDVVPFWSFRGDRCYRTVRNGLREEGDEIEFSGEPHMALEDARRQALQLIKGLTNSKAWGYMDR